nr:MAG TPA: hypothetical protein [Caudoviricetes sp.]
MAFAPPDSPTGGPASGIRYGFYHVYPAVSCLAAPYLGGKKQCFIK